MLTEARRRHVFLLAVTLMAALFALVGPSSPNTALAQNAEDAAEKADAPAGDDGGGNEEATQTPAASRSFLSWLVEASGWFGAVLLLMSFVMVALIMMNVLQVRRDVLMPPDFVEEFEQKINTKDYQGAYESAKADDSFLARVLTNGLSRLNRGYDEAIEGMQEVGEEENMALDHRLSYLALIGAIGPMIGLAGTVWGMIMSFEKIATSTTSPKPAELADGISTALFTTLEGLFVAIPAMVGYSILRNRVSKLVLEVGIISEGLMSKLPMARKGGGGAAATAPAAPQK